MELGRLVEHGGEPEMGETPAVRSVEFARELGTLVDVYGGEPARGESPSVRAVEFAGELGTLVDEKGVFAAATSLRAP